MLNLHQTDAYRFMSKMADESVDFLFTDPPYGTTEAEWDIKLDLDRFFAQAWRVLKPGGQIAMFCQMPLGAELIMHQKRFFRYEWIWEKVAATGFLNANKMPLRAHENILVFGRSAGRWNREPIPGQEGEPYARHECGHTAKLYSFNKGKIPCESVNGERAPRDVIRMSVDRNAVHPTSKPLALCRAIISQYTLPGDIVLDPFAGSGSIILAAHAMNRTGIGVEKEERFCKEIMRRFNQLTPDLL